MDTNNNKKNHNDSENELNWENINNMSIDELVQKRKLYLKNRVIQMIEYYDKLIFNKMDEDKTNKMLEYAKKMDELTRRIMWLTIGSFAVALLSIILSFWK